MISISYLGLVRADVSTLSWEGTTLVLFASYLNWPISQQNVYCGNRLKGKVSYTNIAQFLLPNEFTLTELQTVYELIL